MIEYVQDLIKGISMTKKQKQIIIEKFKTYLCDDGFILDRYDNYKKVIMDKVEHEVRVCIEKTSIRYEHKGRLTGEWRRAKSFYVKDMSWDEKSNMPIVAKYI